MVSAMHKQSVFTAMVTVSAVIGVVLWELGLQETGSGARAVQNAISPSPRADWSNYFEAALLCSVFIAFYIRFYASYYALAKINRALSLGCILLFAAVVVVLVKTAPCGTAYGPVYNPCFEVLTGIAFGFALLDLVIFLVWKCLFHYNSGGVASDSGNATIVVKAVDVEAPVIKEVEVKSEAALEKEEEAKKEEEEAKAKKEEAEEKTEEEEEKKAEEEKEEEEQKSEEPVEAEPLLQEEKKEEEKKE